MRVLGIDPGLRNLGWGVIDADGNRLSHVANGICHSNGADLAARLLSLYQQLTDIVARYAPETAAVEQTFVNKDGAGTLKLGQARGIALLVPAQYGIDVGEYFPNTVKKTVVGVGHGRVWALESAATGAGVIVYDLRGGQHRRFPNDDPTFMAMRPILGATEVAFPIERRDGPRLSYTETLRIVRDETLPLLAP